MSEEKQPQTTQFGFVSVIGAPNAGKSTLMNQMVGAKVSIVSPKAQTTRTRVLGITINDFDGHHTQIAFVDTPGIFKAKKRRLDKAIVAAAWEGVVDSDLILFIVDTSLKSPLHWNEDILEGLRSQNLGKKKVTLVLNKVDMINPEKLFKISAGFNDAFDFDATFMVSAEKDRGVDDVLNHFTKLLPEGPFMYPEDEMTDMPSRLMAAEITREQVFRKLHDELPYNMAVDTESWDERSDGSVEVGQVIYVTRDAHKPIVLGKGGQKIKAMGKAARLEMEQIFDRPFHVKLFVKVREQWDEDPEHFRIWGLDPHAE
jgi:GTP-binding protein Era|tara:strand:- start:95954 stop:96898 length:945 start_codon:yes stop_codon:yes gene_type:complete